MTTKFIEGFGFEIYKLRDSKPDHEIIIYDIEKKQYNFYSTNRALDFLELELIEKGIDLNEFLVKDLGFDEKVNTKKIFKAWFMAEIKLIDSIKFYPIKDKIFTHEDKTYFNTFNYLDSFTPPKKKLKWSFEDFKTNLPHHYSLLSNLHNNDDKAIQDTLMKIADRIKNPNKKAQDCLVFYPGEGAGKGILYKYVLQPIFKEYASKVLMKRLNGDFNGFLRKSLILVLEEGKRDLELIETLKEVVTEGTILINEKNKNQVEEEVFFLTIVFSNNMNPIDLGKRRGSYHLCKPLGKNVEQSQKKGKELCDNLPNETPQFIEYLHSLDFEHQEALMPFNTLAKAQVTDLNKSPLELFYDYLCSFPNIQNGIMDLYLRRTPNKIIKKIVLKYQEDGEEIEYITKDELREAYNNFSHLEGLRSNIIKHNKDIVQLWALFNLPDDAYKRKTIRDPPMAGRKLDHIRLDVLNEHIKEKYEELNEK